MRIQSLHIEGYKALRHFDLENIPDFVVFAGPNGSGKSAIFEAVALLKETVGAYAGLQVPPGAVNLKHDFAEVLATFSLSPAEADRAGSLTGNAISANEVLRASIRIDGQRATAVERHPALRAIFPLYEPGGEVGVFEFIQAHRRMAPRVLEQISLAPLDPQRMKQFRLTSLENKFNELKDQLAAIALEDLFLSQETGEPRDSLATLKALFNRLFAPKRFLRVLPTRGGVRFEIETQDGIHDVDLLSSGEMEIFMVFATLLQLAPRSSVVMYDEPELHLHGSVERQVASELLSLSRVPNQVLVGTHSVEFIGATPLTSLFHVEPYSGKNQVASVSEQQERLELFQSLGASVGLQLISPKVAFLEGETAGGDKELLNTIFPELRNTVSFVPSRSVSDVMELAGRAADLLAQGTKYSRFFAIRDRDYLTDDQRDELMERYPGLVILNRYHIENYLLDPTAVAGVMADLGTNPDVPEEVLGKLEEIAQELREQAVAGWIRYQLDFRLRGLLLRAGGDEALAVLKSSAQSLRDSVASHFTERSIDGLAQQRTTLLQSGWRDKVWLVEIPGRDLLRRFVGRYAHGVDPIRFRNLVASWLRDHDSETKQSLRELLTPLF